MLQLCITGLLPHLGRIMTTGRPSLSACGDTNVLPVSASFSTCAHTISCGRVSRRLQDSARQQHRQPRLQEGTRTHDWCTWGEVVLASCTFQ